VDSIKRAFADLQEGQVHYWVSRFLNPDKLPLLLLHPGPGTARIQVPLLERLSKSRTVIAPDLMGMGDSAAPPFSDDDPPGLDYYRDAVARFLDVIDVQRCDVYGSSLGGRVAIDLAVNNPSRVRCLILGQVKIMSGNDLAAMAEHHAPKVEPDQSGVYVRFLWNRLRYLYTYFPWFKRTEGNRRRQNLPSADLMHIAFIEQVKMATTAHWAFSAYYRYPIEEKLGQIKAKTLVRGDSIAKMIPNAIDWDPALKGDPMTSDPEVVSEFANQINAFLCEAD